MRIFTRLLTLALVCMISFASMAQTRYVDEIFSEVTVSNPTPVASNYTILPFIASMGQVGMRRQPLVAQFYAPKGDTETKRPLVVYIHTGNFFPYPANGSCGGTLADSTNVEVAKRLAKRGYVVAMVNYRQGWNPFDNNELIRRYFLINAAYRGVQDMSTYVRYFRRSVQELGNPHGIDADKITMWGQGTGGYLSLASAYLNKYSEIVTAPGGKFILPLPTGGTVPMVIEAYNGNIDATGPITTVDATYSALSQLKVGDTLCVPNHVADPAGNPYSSDFALAVNMGGAIGDSSWINAGEVPLISFHVTTDPFAPCETDILNVPTPTGPKAVVEVSGSCDISAIIARKGNNDVFKTIPSIVDPAASWNKSGYPGFYEFKGTPNNTSSPWEWSATATTTGGATGCNTDGVSARKYIDTIMTYFVPRACFALNLPCKDKLINTKDITDADVQLSIAPNPATFEVNITTADNAPMKAVTILDITGRVLAKSNVEASRFVVERYNLNIGMYFVKIDFEKGSLTKKIIFE